MKESLKKFIHLCENRLLRLLAIVYPIVYRFLRYCYRFTLKVLKILFYNNSNPYEFISLNPPNLEINIIDKHYSAHSNFPKYTVITPVLNEAKSIAETLGSIENQTLLPDQVIIVDGGSSDATIDIIDEYKKSSKLDIFVLFSDKKNIGAQRNLAIDKARNNLLVNVDAGTVLDKNYAANLLGPFTEHQDLDLACGVHYPKHRYLWSVYLSPAKHFEFRKEPYGACIAYKRDIALKVGKYPEYITYAGEDTLFCYKYKQASKKWIFNREAFILWEHPTTFQDTKKKLRNYVKANFEIGLWPYFYSNYLFEPNLGIGWLNKVLLKDYKNFLHNQAEVEVSRRKINGLCFIFAKTNIDDVEDSNYPRNIALQFIDKNYKTFFVSINNNKHQNSAGKIQFIRTDHTLLELVHYKHFSIKYFSDRYESFLERSIFIIQFAEKDLCQKILKLKSDSDNILIIYDRVHGDDVNTYDLKLLERADVILTTQIFIDSLRENNYNSPFLVDKCIALHNEKERQEKLQELTKAWTDK